VHGSPELYVVQGAKKLAKNFWDADERRFSGSRIKKEKSETEKKFVIFNSLSARTCENLRPNEIYDSRVLRNGRLPTPSGPEGSSGRNCLRVPQGSLAITLLLVLLFYDFRHFRAL